MSTKYIDGLLQPLTSNFSSIVTEAFQLSPGNDGYYLQSDAEGNGTWAPIPNGDSSAVYYVDPDLAATNTDLRQFVTIQECMAFLVAAGPPALGSQYYVRLAAKTHVITAQVQMPVSTLVYAESPGALVSIFVVAPISGAAFICNTQTNFKGLSLFGNEFCDHILEIPQGVNVNTFDCIYSGTLSHAIVTTVSGSIAPTGAPHSGSFTYFRVGILALDFSPPPSFQRPNNIGGYGIYNAHDNFGLFGFSNIISSKVFVIADIFHGLPFDFCYLSGTDSKHIAHAMNLESLNVVFTCEGESETTISSSFSDECATFLIADGDSVSRFQSVSCLEATDLMLDVRTSTATVNFTSGTLIADKISVPLINNVTLNFFEEKPRNLQGQHLLGNLVIGSVYAPSTCYFGNGGISFQSYTILKVNGVLLSFTDVTSFLSAGNQLPLDLYDNAGANVDSLYIGSDFKFSSLIFTLTTANVGGEFTIEYYDSTLTWVPVNYFVSQHETPYISYANVLFETTETLDVRIDINIYTADYDWAINDIIGISKYWLRITPTNAMSTIPAATEAYIYHNSTIVDPDGITLKHGIARTTQTYPYSINLIRPAGANVPGNQDIFYGEKMRIGRSRNSFAENEAGGFTFFPPVDFDSSSPITITFVFCSSDPGAGLSQYLLQITSGIVRAGTRAFLDELSAAGVPVPNQRQQVVQLIPNQTNGQFIEVTTAKVFIPEIIANNGAGVPRELITFDIERLLGGIGDLIITDINVTYTSYIDGIIN